MYNSISKRLVKDSIVKSMGSKSLFNNLSRMSVNTKTLDEKEKGDELIYFTREDCNKSILVHIIYS